LSQFILRPTEISEKLLVCGGLFEGIQRSTVQILQESFAKQFVVGCLPHDGGDEVETGLLACPPSPLASDEFIGRRGTVSIAAHDNRLQQAYLLNRVDQFRHGVFVENLPGLAWIGDNVLGWDLDVGGIWHGGHRTLIRLPCGGDKGTQSTPQATSWFGHSSLLHHRTQVCG